MLKLSVTVGQWVIIGGPTAMCVEQKGGQAVRLVFDAGREVPIYRAKADEPRSALADNGARCTACGAARPDGPAP